MAAGQPSYPSYERYFYPQALSSRPRPRLSRVLLTIGLALVLLFFMVVFAIAALIFAVARYHPCISRCGPRVSNVMPATASFMSSGSGFQVDYPVDWTIDSKDADSVSFTTYTGVLSVHAQKAGRTDEQLVQDAVGRLSSARWQGLQPVGPIRGARVGFQDGKGTLYSANYVPAGGQAVKTRIAVIAATRAGLSVIVVALAESHTADVPSGLREAEVFDYVLSQFRWPGEPRSG